MGPFAQNGYFLNSVLFCKKLEACSSLNIKVNVPKLFVVHNHPIPTLQKRDEEDEEKIIFNFLYLVICFNLLKLIFSSSSSSISIISILISIKQLAIKRSANEALGVKFLLLIERSANETLAVKYLLSIERSANETLAVKYLLSIEWSPNEALAVKYMLS